jgi:hypothetical protein
MSEDLPRYTWANDSGLWIRVMRRDGLYGQTQVGTWTGAGKACLSAQDKEIANVICEYLDARDRQRNGDTSERT